MNDESLPRQETSAPLVGLAGKLTASFSGQVGIFVIGFATQVILARALGPEGKGEYSLAVLVLSVLYQIINLNIGVTNGHFIGRHPDWAPAVLGNSLLLALGLGGLVAVGIALIDPGVISKLLPQVDAGLLQGMIWVIPALMVMDFFSMSVLGQERVGLFNLLITGRWLLVLLMVAAAAGWGKLNAALAVKTWVWAVYILAPVAFIVATGRARFRLAVSWRVFVNMLKYALQMHISILASFIKERSDLFIMQYFLAAAALGQYSIAFALVTVLGYLPASVAQVLLPYISHRQDEAGNVITPRLCRISLAISFTAALLMAALGWWGIRLIFGAAFSPAYEVMLILLPGVVVFGLAKLLAGDLGGRGKPRYSMIISTSFAALSVGLNLWLIPAYGLKGAALTMTIANTVGGLAFLYAFHRESRIPYLDTVLIRRSDLTDLRRFAGKLTGR